MKVYIMVSIGLSLCWRYSSLAVKGDCDLLVVIGTYSCHFWCIVLLAVGVPL